MTPRYNTTTDVIDNTIAPCNILILLFSAGVFMSLLFQIAINYSTGLTKETIFHGVRDLFQRLGQVKSLITIRVYFVF